MMGFWEWYALIFPVAVFVNIVGIYGLLRFRSWLYRRERRNR